MLASGVPDGWAGANIDPAPCALTESNDMSRTPAKNTDQKARHPRKAFINVLVRTSTRSALARLKIEIGLLSQGEVIDHLVALRRKGVAEAEALEQRP